MSFIPSQQQQEAINKSLPSILGGDISAIVGSAGTGKSKTASVIIKSLPPDWTVTFLAFTNKATQNIRSMLFQEGLGMQCEASTIHSFLKINRQKINQQTGKRSFHQAKGEYHNEQYDPEKHLLVVDEMGTVPNNEESPLAYLLMQLPNPILALGDDCQLPPPKEKIGYLFELFADQTTRLTETHRFGGCLLETATEIRDHIKDYAGLDCLEESNNDGQTGTFKLGIHHFKRQIDRLVKEDEFLQNPNFFRVLTWRKVTQDFWNQYVRQIVYGSKAQERFLPGERIIAMEACNQKFEVRTKDRTFLKTDKLLSASEEATISNVSILESDFKSSGIRLDYKTYFIEATSEQSKPILLRVIHEDEESKLDKVLKQLAKERKWSLYWEIKDYYHTVKSAFSLNIDRIQGMTIQNIAIDLKDAMNCRDIWHRNRIAYTMVTRAKEKVYLN